MPITMDTKQMSAHSHGDRVMSANRHGTRTLTLLPVAVVMTYVALSSRRGSARYLRTP